MECYGTHNNIPVEGCMPHDIQVAENTFLDLKENGKYPIGQAENIIIEGKLIPTTQKDNPLNPLPKSVDSPWLQEMGDDGVLNWREARPTLGRGSVAGMVADGAGQPVAGAILTMGEVEYGLITGQGDKKNER
jgi:hypothetical protein